MASPARTSADQRFATSVQVDDGVAVVHVRGALDIAHEPAFSQTVERVRRDGHARLRIDLRDLDLIDSAGLGAVLRICREWADAARRVELVPSSSPAARRVFTLIDLNDGERLPFVRAS